MMKKLNSWSLLQRFMSPVSLLVEGKTIFPPDSVRNLGVVFDSQMSMSMYVKTLCRSLTFQLRDISRIRRFLDFDICHLSVRALILSSLNYGNGLLLFKSIGHSKNCKENGIGRLKSFARLQNATTHLHIYVNCTGCPFRIELPPRSWFSCFSASTG